MCCEENPPSLPKLSTLLGAIREQEGSEKGRGPHIREPSPQNTQAVQTLPALTETQNLCYKEEPSST